MEEDKEWIKQTLVNYERSRCISKFLDIDSNNAVGKGENYFSDIFRMKLKVVLNSGETSERSLIYKIVPRGDNKSPDVKKSGLFRKEARIYMDILPEMGKVLKKAKPDAETFWPEFYGVKGNYEGFMMEDLSLAGYKMADRLKQLDFEHAELAVKELAVFHALAAVLVERGEISYNEFHPTFVHNDEKKLEDGIVKVLTALIKVIEEDWKGEWMQYVEGIEKLKTTMTKLLMKTHEKDENKFNTLNHGDYWTNNILFKYNSDGQPQHIKLVDYQMIFYNKPTLDLHWFFNTSLRPEIRDRTAQLLTIYYSTLESSLKLFDFAAPIPSFEEISESFHETRMYGYFVTLAITPVMICSALENIIHEKIGPESNLSNIEYTTHMYLCYAYGIESNTNALKSCIREMKSIGLI